IAAKSAPVAVTATWSPARALTLPAVPMTRPCSEARRHAATTEPRSPARSTLLMPRSSAARGHAVPTGGSRVEVEVGGDHLDRLPEHHLVAGDLPLEGELEEPVTHLDGDAGDLLGALDGDEAESLGEGVEVVGDLGVVRASVLADGLVGPPPQPDLDEGGAVPVDGDERVHRGR